MFYVGTCPFCEQGNLGVRLCSNSEDAVILCDECDAVWLSPEITGKPLFPEEPDLPCPYCAGNLTESPARWASMGDILKSGWITAIKGETD